MATDYNHCLSDSLPPHNEEAELAVLGSLLIDPSATPRVAAFLRAEDFYFAKNGWVYEAILRNGSEADLLTVSADLTANGLLDETGGDEYLAQLMASVPTALNVEAYGKLVEDRAMRRRMLNAASDIAKLAFDTAKPIEQVISQSEGHIFGVSDQRVSGQMVPMSKAVSDYFSRVEYLHDHKDEPQGIPTGYTELDRMLGGLQRGDLIIIAARPGVGKTSLKLNIAYNAAYRYRQRVAIFSLEMGNEQLVQRMVATETGIDSQRLRKGDLSDDEWGNLSQVCMQMSDVPIFLDDSASLTPLDLRVKARRIHQEYGLDLIVVDYLQLMQGDASSGGRNENRVQEISYISRSLKQIARELKVPVIAGSQLSRVVEQRADKRPMLSDLRESGCLSGDTLITLAENGSRVPVRELVGKTGFEIIALSERWKTKRAMVTRAFSTGVKPVYALHTKLGRSVKATANHKFLTSRGWQRLDAIQPGDHIALPRIIAANGAPVLSLAQLGLLGLLIGDGCTLPRHVLQYTTRELDLAEHVSALATSCFGDAIVPRIQRERSWYQVYLASTRHHTHGVRNAIAEWLDDLNIWGLRSHEKFVPDVVFTLPNDEVSVFLRHLWATDGCVRMRHGVTTCPAVYYASSSLRLARDVQALLLRFAINARLKTVAQAGKGHDQYHVIVSGRTDLLHFCEAIGAIGFYKLQSVAEIIVHLADRPENTNRDVVPNVLWREAAIVSMQEHKISQRALHTRMDMAYAGATLFKQNASRTRAERIADAAQSPAVSDLARSDVYWDQVAGITPAGTEEVFDLSVPGPHNFVANEIFVHNSIEQDADIVSFIYRDEMYNPDTEFKNVAEIIIGKNRNGPTGKVDLYFDKSLTAFRNLARDNVSVK